MLTNEDEVPGSSPFFLSGGRAGMQEEEVEAAGVEASSTGVEASSTLDEAGAAEIGETGEPGELILKIF